MADIAEIRCNDLQIEPVNPLREAGWDDLVKTHPAHGLFHGAAWARVLHEAYGFSPVYFTAREEGRLVAMLPTMEARSLFTGRRGICLPFADECGPLASPGLPMRTLFQQVLNHGRRRNWRYFECRGTQGLEDEVLSSTSFCTHVLPLEGSPEEIACGFDSGVRRAIRKAEHSGLQVEVAHSNGALRAFFELHCRTRKKHGLPPQPYSFFEQLERHVLTRGHGFIVVARQAKRPVAAAMFLLFGRRAMYKFGASDERLLNLRGNNLVIWEAIQWLARHGFESLHFGRTSTANEGLRRFKLGWGATEQTLDYFKYDFRQGAFVSDRGDGSEFYRTLFRAMPLRFLRFLGRLLYRHAACVAGSLGSQAEFLGELGERLALAL